jgi:hypothetical protein
VRPDERMNFVVNGSGSGTDASVVNVLRRDKNAEAFGISNINPEPMACTALLLPPAKLRYGNVRRIDLIRSNIGSNRSSFYILIVPFAFYLSYLVFYCIVIF